MTIQPSTLPAPCYRCTGAPISWSPGVPTDGLCLACAGEVEANRANRADARDELVATVYTGHGLSHGTYRPDIRMGLL